MATRSATRASPPAAGGRRAAAAGGRCAAADDGRAGEAQLARPRLHPGHQGRLRHPRRCVRQRRATGAQASPPARHPCQRRGEGRRECGARQS